jgi:hypothetical protein
VLPFTTGSSYNGHTPRSPVRATTGSFDATTEESSEFIPIYLTLEQARELSSVEENNIALFEPFEVKPTSLAFAEEQVDPLRKQVLDPIIEAISSVSLGTPKGTSEKKLFGSEKKSFSRSSSQPINISNAQKGLRIDVEGIQKTSKTYFFLLLFISYFSYHIIFHLFIS